MKKNRVAVEDDLELFDDELAWEEVTPKQTAQQTPATNAVSSSLASSSISSTPASFSAFSRGAPLLATPQSGQARRALLAADFGLNVKEEMAEWKQNKCPWLDDIRDANLRRPNDEGYDKSTLHIPKKLMNELTIPQQQYWNIKVFCLYCSLFFFEQIQQSAAILIGLCGFKWAPSTRSTLKTPCFARSCWVSKSIPKEPLVFRLRKSTVSWKDSFRSIARWSW